jgi:hypothetical protein
MTEKIDRNRIIIIIAFLTQLRLYLFYIGMVWSVVYRYHSFYPWHSGGDYMHLSSERDLQMLPWVREFK